MLNEKIEEAITQSTPMPNGINKKARNIFEKLWSACSEAQQNLLKAYDDLDVNILWEEKRYGFKLGFRYGLLTALELMSMEIF